MVSKANFASKAIEEAKRVEEKIKNHGLLEGKHPQTIAAIAIYIGALLQDADPAVANLKYVAQYAEVKEATIYQRL